MVMTCNPNSCTGRIFAAADCLYTPCSAVASVAQKIADFVTGIFTAIANFVKYCLCMSTPAVSAATATPTSATALPATTSVPTLAPQATTSTATVAPISAPAIDPNLVAAGKQVLLGIAADLDQVHPNNQFRERLETKESGREAFACALIITAIGLPTSQPLTLRDFVTGCAVEPDYHPMQDLMSIKLNHDRLDEPSQSDALRRFTGSWGARHQQSTQAVAALLREANAVRDRFTQDPIFCAAADAARAEVFATRAVLAAPRSSMDEYFIEQGVGVLQAALVGIDQRRPTNPLRAQLSAQEDARHILATLLICAIATSPPNTGIHYMALISKCNIVPAKYYLGNFYLSFTRLDGPAQEAALAGFIAGQEPNQQQTPAVAKFLSEANFIRRWLTENSHFSQLAVAARAELVSEVF